MILETKYTDLQQIYRAVYTVKSVVQAFFLFFLISLFFASLILNDINLKASSISIVITFIILVLQPLFLKKKVQNKYQNLTLKIDNNYNIILKNNSFHEIIKRETIEIFKLCEDRIFIIYLSPGFKLKKTFTIYPNNDVTKEMLAKIAQRYPIKEVAK